MIDIMVLDAGTKLGPYQIIDRLGAGGMGEVYLAHDTKLDRQVAIKILPAAMTRDADSVTRFAREAKLLASINHPNIAAIYDFHDADQTNFIVMEHVNGETLSQRLKKNGPLAAEDALEVARQIAVAVEAAHEKGIIHRDLKPGNVMIGPELSVKVLDFGLAKATSDGSKNTKQADSPTVTIDHTRPGVVLGTAPYMSPEQARGRPIDMRSDIWSFGVILFECLTGVSLFTGATLSDSIAAILHKAPNWSLLPSATPPTVRLLLRRCLTRDRRQRLQAIGDARVELEAALQGEESLTTEMVPRHPQQRLFTWLPWLFCAVFAVAMIFTLTRKPIEREVPNISQVKKSVITLRPGSSINWRGTKDTWSKMGYSQLLAISRNGQRIILTVQEGQRTSLYLKDDHDFMPRKVAGSDGARGPFLSPDGLWVGFLTEEVLRKVRLPGGASQPVCEFNSTAFDATWLDDGTIIYSTDFGLRRVAENGSTAQILTSIDIDAGIRGHQFPQQVAGYPLVTFTVSTETGQHTALLSLDDGQWSILKQHATDARYVASGHLLFARDGELFAATFDPSNPTKMGTEEPIVSGVQTTPGLGGAVVHLFDTSDTGVLVYAPSADPPEPDTLLWVDHNGQEQPIVKGDGYWMHQRLSPNGEQILFNSMTRDGMLDLYIYDTQRDQFNRLTRNGNTYDAEWSPDGQTVGFAALDTDGRSIYLIPTDFSGPARKIIDGSESRPHFSQWSSKSSTLVFFDRSKQGGVWAARPVKGAKLQELMNTPLGEGWARISPDGQLLAYVGFEGPRRDVYVQAYPDLGPRLRVSRNGGGEPRWAHDSRTLYYREDGQIFQATVETVPRLDVKEVTALDIDDVYDAAASGHQHYDLSLDSSKFLMVRHGQRFYPQRVCVMENCLANIKEQTSR